MTKPNGNAHHETLTLKQLHDKLDADWKVKIKMQEDNKATYPSVPHGNQKIYAVTCRIQNTERRINEFRC